MDTTSQCGYHLWAVAVHIRNMSDYDDENYVNNHIKRKLQNA